MIRSARFTLPLIAVAACTASVPPSPSPAPPRAAPIAPREDPCHDAHAAQARVPALLAAGQLDRTVRVLRRAAERCPTAAPHGRASLVRALARIGRTAEARAEIAAIEADAHAGADAKTAAAEARATLAAIVAAPSPSDRSRLLADADALLAQGIAGADRDKLERARALYKEAAAGPTPDGDALHGAGRAERALGDAAAAQALFDRAVVALEARAGAAAHADAAAEITEPVTSAAWSPGSDRLAIAAGDAVTIFDVRALREHGRLDGEAIDVAFAGSDGARLIVSRRAGLDVFDVRTLQKLRSLEGTCAAMAASTRAPLVACGSPEGKVTLWDVDQGRSIHAPLDVGAAPLQLRFSEDGQSLVALTARSLSLWEVARGKSTRTLAARRGSELRDLWPLRDGQSFALVQAPAGAEKVDVDRVDRRTLALRGRIAPAKVDEERAGPPPGVSEPGAWSADGRLYLLRADASLRDRGGARVPLGGPPARGVISAGFSGDGKVLGAGYEGGVFRSFDAETGRVRKTYAQTWETRVLAFRVDRGEYVARVASSPRTAWSLDGRVEARAHKQLVIVRNAKDEKVCEGEGGKDDILFAAMSPDGGELVTLSATEALFWDTARCTVTAALPSVPGSSPVAAAFTPEGDAVAIAWRGARDELRVVDLASRTDRLIGPSDGARRVFFLARGRSVALADPLRIWDLEAAKPLDHGPVRGSILALAPDGKVSVSTEGHEGALLFTHIQTGQLLVGLRALGDGASAYVFAEGAAPFDIRVDPLDDKAREALVCRIGPRAHPYELCAERSEVPGLFAKAIRGDRSFLEP